jgi:predicted lactoylglutathione lyase
MYKLMINPITNQLDKVMLILNNNIVVFGLNNPESSTFINFKKQIAEETAELQNANGNTMTAAEAKSFVATLP